MPRAREPLTKHNVMLTEGSYERLQDLYSETVGAAAVIRLLIKRHLDWVDKNAGESRVSDILKGVDL